MSLQRFFLSIACPTWESPSLRAEHGGGEEDDVLEAFLLKLWLCMDCLTQCGAPGTCSSHPRVRNSCEWVALGIMEQGRMWSGAQMRFPYNRDPKMSKHTALEFCMKTWMTSHTELQLYPWKWMQSLQLERLMLLVVCFYHLILKSP